MNTFINNLTSNSTINGIIQLFSYKITWFIVGIIFGLLFMTWKHSYDNISYQLKIKNTIDSLEKKIIYNDQKIKILNEQVSEYDNKINNLQLKRDTIYKRIKITDPKIYEQPKTYNPDSAYIWLQHFIYDK